MVPVTTAAALPLVTSLYGVDAAVLPYLSQWRERYARLFRDGDLFLAEGPEMRKKVIAAGAPARNRDPSIALDLTKYPRWGPTALHVLSSTVRREERAARRHCRVRRARRRVRSAHDDRRGGGGGRGTRAHLALGLGDSVEFAGMEPHAGVISARRRCGVHPPSVTASDGDSRWRADDSLEAQPSARRLTTRHADIRMCAAGLASGCATSTTLRTGTALVAALQQQTGSARRMGAHHDIRRSRRVWRRCTRACRPRAGHENPPAAGTSPTASRHEVYVEAVRRCRPGHEV